LNKETVLAVFTGIFTRIARLFKKWMWKRIEE